MAAVTLLRRTFLAVAVAVAIVVPLGTAGAGADAPAVDVLSVNATPTGADVLVSAPSQLAGHDLTSASWTVTIGGKKVATTVTQVSNNDLEVVLALDTSGSMKGAPLDAAKNAAASFVDALPAAARIGVISFSSAPVVVVPLTSDHAAAIDALRKLQAQGETALYDGVVAASHLFTPGTSTRRAVVVLSDGRDTISKAKVEDAVGALTGLHATGYVASLVTPDTDAATLQALADRTHGRVVAATDTAGVRTVFSNIGSALTNQYHLRFGTRVSGQTQMALSVTAAGITASSDRVIEIPAAPVRPTPTTVAPARVVRATQPGWLLPTGLGLAAAGLLAFGLVVFAPRRTRTVRNQWIAQHSAPKESSSGFQDLTHRATDFAESSLRRRGLTEKVDAMLEGAGIPMRPGEIAVLVAGADAVFALLVMMLFGPIFGMVAFGAGLYAARWFLRFKGERRCKKFGSQLPDTLQLMSGSLRAGYGLAQALDSVAKNAESPTAEEFGRLVMELRVGRPTDEALASMAARVHSDDFDWVVEAMSVNREIGGDLTELLDRAGETIRERERVRRQIKTLSAEGRLSAIVLIAIPVLLFLYMEIANPTYIGELTGSAIGFAMLAAAVSMLTAGAFWMKKLVRVDF